MNRKIFQGDVLEQIKQIPSESIDVIVTSPPYYNLRDYSVDGQIGLEQTPHQYIAKLMQVMTECKRVLKSTGSIWVNMGDSYCAKTVGNIRPKSKYGIPSRFEVACIDDGWISRNVIPWIKANNMPSSVKDRFTNKWEPVFFFTKNPKYYFNLDAVREPCITESKPFNVRVRDTKRGLQQTKLTGGMSEKEDQEYDKAGIHEKYRDDKNSNVARLHKDRAGNPNKQDNVLGADGKPKANYKGFNKRWKDRKFTEQTVNRKVSNGRYVDTGEYIVHPKGKNPGDVFWEEPKSYRNTQKYFKNESFFNNIDSQIKAYWLGFLFADGYVDRYNVILGLQTSDTHHIEKLRDLISQSIPIRRNGNGMGVQISSVRLSAALMSHGMDEKKKVTGLPSEFEYDFIRGLFDGDGSIYNTVRANGYVDWGWSLMGEYPLLEWVQERLEPACDLGKTEIRTYRNISELRYGGNKQVSRIGQYLYHGDPEYRCKLERKFDKFMQLFPVNTEAPDVFYINPKPFKEAHFAVMPVELPKRILRCAAPKNAMIFDPFLGAGTTAVAAEQLGLQWCGIELNPEYTTMAKKRLLPYKNKKL